MKKPEMITAALLSVIGLMILASPNQFVKVIVILLGVIAIANGILNLVSFSSLIEDKLFKRDVLIRGWLSILVGILAVSLPLAVANIMWTVMLYVLAIYLLISSGMEIYAITRLKNTGIKTKQYIIESIASILLAIILFVFSREIGITIVKIIGIILVAIGFILILYYLKSKPQVIQNDFMEEEENLSTEASKTE